MIEEFYYSMINIAIDGPSGSGKSTLARKVAEKLGYIYVDTGALYRSIGLYAYRNEIKPDDEKAVINMLPMISVSLEYSEDGAQKVILNGEDVSTLIRTPEISMYASKISAIPEVRKFLLDLQRSIAKQKNVIMDGRDIGTVILPDAQVKIFLFAKDEVRAKRRYIELTEKGVNTTFEEVLADMTKRDKDDSTRKVAPAIPAEDAIMLDNSELDLDGTMLKVIEIINRKLNEQ